MRLRGDAEIHGTATPLGCQVRRLQLPRGHCRGFRDRQLWGDGQRRANLVLARPVGIKASEPWYLVSNRAPTLDLVWAYGQRFCCEQLFRDQKSGIFQLEKSRLRDPARIDRLLLVVAIAVLLSSLQGYAISLGGQRPLVDAHWKRGLSFVRIGLHWLQQSAITAGRALLGWMPIPLQPLEPCWPSRGVRRRQKEPWFSRVELPPPLPIAATAPMAVA
jgi:hypothetical protein